MKSHPTHPHRPSLRPCLLPAFALTASLLPAQAGVSVDPRIQYHYSTGRGEGLRVSHNAHRMIISIERYNPSTAQLAASSTNESRGSVLLLEVSRALDGVFEVIERVPVGQPAAPAQPNSGATLEAVDSAQHGRWIFVSISNGGGSKGTVARLELRNH